MENVKIAKISASVFLLLAGFLLYFMMFHSGRITGGVIGNNSNRDEHGCLIHIGYTWNETEQACVLSWINGTGRYQVQDFSECEAAGYNASNITINNITSGQSNVFQQCQEPNGTVFVSGLNLTYVNNNNVSLMNLSVGRNGSFNLTKNNLVLNTSQNSSLNYSY